MYGKPLSKKERKIRDQRFEEQGYQKVYLLIRTECVLKYKDVYA